MSEGDKPKLEIYLIVSYRRQDTGLPTLSNPIYRCLPYSTGNNLVFSPYVWNIKDGCRVDGGGKIIQGIEKTKNLEFYLCKHVMEGRILSEEEAGDKGRCHLTLSIIHPNHGQVAKYTIQSKSFFKIGQCVSIIGEGINKRHCRHHQINRRAEYVDRIDTEFNIIYEYNILRISDVMGEGYVLPRRGYSGCGNMAFRYIENIDDVFLLDMCSCFLMLSPKENLTKEEEESCTKKKNGSRRLTTPDGESLPLSSPLLEFTNLPTYKILQNLMGYTNYVFAELKKVHRDEYYDSSPPFSKLRLQVLTKRILSLVELVDLTLLPQARQCISTGRDIHLLEERVQGEWREIKIWSVENRIGKMNMLRVANIARKFQDKEAFIERGLFWRLNISWMESFIFCLQSELILHSNFSPRVVCIRNPFNICSSDIEARVLYLFENKMVKIVVKLGNNGKKIFCLRDKKKEESMEVVIRNFPDFAGEPHLSQTSILGLVGTNSLHLLHFPSLADLPSILAASSRPYDAKVQVLYTGRVFSFVYDAHRDGSGGMRIAVLELKTGEDILVESWRLVHVYYTSTHQVQTLGDTLIGEIDSCPIFPFPTNAGFLRNIFKKSVIKVGEGKIYLMLTISEDGNPYSELVKINSSTYLLSYTYSPLDNTLHKYPPKRVDFGGRNAAHASMGLVRYRGREMVVIGRLSQYGYLQVDVMVVTRGKIVLVANRSSPSLTPPNPQTISSTFISTPTNKFIIFGWRHTNSQKQAKITGEGKELMGIVYFRVR